MKNIVFVCNDQILLMIYDKDLLTEEIFVYVCFDKDTKSIVPFERHSFLTLEAAMDYAGQQMNTLRF